MTKRFVLLFVLQVFVYRYGADAHVYDYRHAPTPQRPTYQFYHDSAPYYVVEPNRSYYGVRQAPSRSYSTQRSSTTRWRYGW